MGNADLAKKAGVTPAKLVLIAVLAAVLLGVLYLQFGGKKAGKRRTSSTATPQAVRPGDARRANLDSTREELAKVTSAASNRPSPVLGQWKAPPLAKVIQHDPFTLPASFPQPKSPAELAGVAQTGTRATDAAAQQAAIEAELQKTQIELDGLKQKGVHVVIKRRAEYVAIIGDKEVHVGDEINGFTVIAIDAEGVRLAKDLSR